MSSNGTLHGGVMRRPARQPGGEPFPILPVEGPWQICSDLQRIDRVPS